MFSRDRVADSVRVQDAGVVDVVESTGCGSGADVCDSGDSVLGDPVGHVVHVASRSSRTVLRSPRPTRVAGVGLGLVTGHGGTRPELQVFESADSGACLVPGSESDYESCADGSSDDLGSSESAEGAGAAVAAAVAAAAALIVAASARAAISAVQDSLGSARRQRKRGKRNAKKFVGSALSRVWRARTVAQIPISSLSPVEEREILPVLASSVPRGTGRWLRFPPRAWWTMKFAGVWMETHCSTSVSRCWCRLFRSRLFCRRLLLFQRFIFALLC